MLVVASPERSTFFISSQHSIVIGCCFTLRFTNDVTVESVTISDAYQARHNLATIHVLHDLEALSLDLLVDVFCNLDRPGRLHHNGCAQFSLCIGSMLGR